MCFFFKGCVIFIIYLSYNLSFFLTTDQRIMAIKLSLSVCPIYFFLQKEVNFHFFLGVDGFQTVKGKTISTDDFYEGQVHTIGNYFNL